MTRRPAALRLLLPALVVVLAGCGGGAETEPLSAAPAPCAAPAAGQEGPAAGPHAAAQVAAVPRPVDARDDRELGQVTPEQADLVQQLRDAEQAPAEASDLHAEPAPEAGHGDAGSTEPADAHAAEAAPAPACTPAAPPTGARAEPVAGGH